MLLPLERLDGFRRVFVFSHLFPFIQSTPNVCVLENDLSIGKTRDAEKLAIQRTGVVINSSKMLRSYALTLSQLSDPKILKPLVFVTLLTIGSIILVLVLGATAIDWAMTSLSNALDGWFGIPEGWLRIITQVIGALFLLMIAYFLFASIHAAFLGLFFDDLLDAIRNRHYPQRMAPATFSLSRSLRDSLRFIILSLTVNLIALPFYLIGWFVPPIGLAAQVLVNGYLLGKEYGYLVGLHFLRLEPNRTKFLKEGILASLVWMVPLVNFIAPVLLAGSILHSRLLNKKGKE